MRHITALLILLSLTTGCTFTVVHRQPSGYHTPTATTVRSTPAERAARPEPRMSERRRVCVKYPAYKCL
jgi:hypothetical protein